MKQLYQFEFHHSFHSFLLLNLITFFYSRYILFQPFSITFLISRFLLFSSSDLILLIIHFLNSRAKRFPDFVSTPNLSP